MLVNWDMVLVNNCPILGKSAYFFKRIKHFLWGGVKEKECFLVVESSWSMGKHVEPMCASEQDVLKFIEDSLTDDPFDEHTLIVNPEAVDIIEKLEWLKETGKVRVAETDVVRLVKPPVPELDSV
jgi:hypothetical protein